MAREDPCKDGDWRRRSAERSYVFGGFRLMPDRQVLLHAGEPVRIGSRAFDILALLVQRAGELVSRAEIEAYVWPQIFVHESNLKVHVAALRKALRAASGEPPGLLNLPGRGYCFTRPVTVEGRAGISAQRTVAARAGAFAPPARIIGRDDEIARLADTVSTRPLTTVVGPGGVGKTTVALAAADRLSQRYEAPPIFVDLAAIDDSRLAVHAIAAALGLRIDLSDLLGGIGEHLRATSRLLILDNCEHLAAAIAAAAEYLAADVGGSALLATSREPLRVRNEHLFRLPPLACPDEVAGPMTAAQALGYPAVALFTTRAAEHAGYALADDDTATVAAICRRLDGLPLAIGLAATHFDRHRPAELLRLLQDTLAPSDQAVDVSAPARHRTLLATLDWSYGLLSIAEARILRHAAIFARDFTPEDAVAILGPTGLDAAEVVAGVESLGAKSFLLADLPQGMRRYRLFESARSYALARLAEAGEADLARLWHARHIVTVLERAEVECGWRAAQDWTAQYAPRLDDLRRAVTWAFGATGDKLIAIRLTAAALPLWGMLSSVDESRPRVTAALRLANDLPACDPRLKMKLACSRAWTLTYAETLTDGEPPWRACVRLARDIGDTEYLLRALHGLATYETFTAAYLAAIDHLLEYMAIAERTPEWSAIPDAQRLLALARVYTGDLGEGSQMLEDLAARFDRVEMRAQATRFAVDRYCIIRSSLAFTRWLRGDSESALVAAGQAVAAALDIDHAMSHSNSLAFADVPLALWTGDLGRAEAGVEALRENLAIRNTGIWRRFIRFFEAALRHARGDRGATADMGESLDELLATGFVTRAPMYLAMLAQALLSEDRVTEARTRIDDAALRIERSGEHWCRPEIRRLQALVLAADGDPGADDRFAEAIEDACAQGVLIFELRAACDLARRLAVAGRRGAALAILEPVHAKFKERGANRDLEVARDLLDALVAEAPAPERA